MIATIGPQHLVTAVDARGYPARPDGQGGGGQISGGARGAVAPVALQVGAGDEINAERVAVGVVEKAADVVLGEVADVRDVAHVAHFPPQRFAGSNHQVSGQKGTEVADVGVGVDGRTARVKAQVAGLGRLKLFHLARHRVIESEYAITHGP